MNEDISGNWNDLKGLEAVANGLAAKLVGGQKTYNDSNEPKQFQINYQNYEVLPGDLDGTYNWSKAKLTCANLTSFGKSDWYLPNKEELKALYKRWDEIGGFTDGWYWSSSEYDTGFAYSHRFNDGNQTNTFLSTKTTTFLVRCIRKY